LSSALTPERFNEVAGQHWGVENSLDGRLDGVMNEDQGRTRMGHGPENLATPRPTAINAIGEEGSKGSRRGKLNRAGSNEDYLARLLTPF
jgi:predicted transposase YbfD/YdcC